MFTGLGLIRVRRIMIRLTPDATKKVNLPCARQLSELLSCLKVTDVISLRTI